MLAAREGRLEHGWTAVMLADSNRHGDIVQYLHQAGADVNIKDSDGSTPLMMAARQVCGDEVKYLHEAGADLNITSGTFTAILW